VTDMTAPAARHGRHRRAPGRSPRRDLFWTVVGLAGPLASLAVLGLVTFGLLG
jgi:hypothetical protein